MRPAFRRGWEGEGKPNRRPGAGQRARSARHSGAAILLWEREGKALGVPTQSGEQRRQPPSAATRHKNGALARRDADGRPAAASKSLPVVARSAASAKGRSADRSRACGKERGKSASGSARKNRALRSAKRGTERVLKPSRSPYGRPFPLCSRSSPGWAGTTGPVRAANRAGCPQGSSESSNSNPSLLGIAFV